MAAFDQRKDAYESKFARDEDLKFHATARRRPATATCFGKSGATSTPPALRNPTIKLGRVLN